MKRRRTIFIALLLVLLTACGSLVSSDDVHSLNPTTATAEDVVTYLDRYGHLPDYYLTKEEARALGWDARSGNLWDVAPGAAIGGDPFYNREGLLPQNHYYEADLKYQGGRRGPSRLVYAQGGPYYESRDHYASFEEVYPS